ncbi:MAG: BamA/TamA family outer membrane protein [Myxococcales bacterium]|nr:BamA/TamA family outer membrane protein [Myxococcales bacterium]
MTRRPPHPARPRARSGRRAGGRGGALALACLALALATAAGGCATIPADRYGVTRVRIEGAEQMSPTSLKNCLATTGRAHAGFTLGIVTPGACGDPPFDADPPRLRLWAWPWAIWPTLDVVALERDRARIVRWYAARGFDHAKVADVRVDPPQAKQKDTIPATAPSPGCERRGEAEGCEAEVTFVVDEGPPTRIARMRVFGILALPPKLRGKLLDALPLHPGDRFDEALYDEGKAKMRDLLGRAGYAAAKVEGIVQIDRAARKAWVGYDVDPGPVCVFGEVRVEGARYLPTAPILGATLIKKGARYSFDEIVDAQRAIQALGAFAAVTVEPIIPKTGKVVDVRIRVTPARKQTFQLGIGVQGGELQTLTESISVPQWDVHLLGRYKHRNLFGGMRQLTLEERPRMIFQQAFPRPDRPRFGNTVRAELRQPGFVEPRTTLIVSAQHTFGPDPYDTFFRHRVDTEVALERAFFGGKLFTRVGLHNSLYRVPSGEHTFDGGPPPSNSVITFPEQIVRLDLRDDPQRPHGGAYFEVNAQEAGYFLPSSWDYVRLTTDARLYAPLPLGITLAGRFALGMLFVHHADAKLDPTSQLLGPRDYRLRGGGASSDRGFPPGRLGDGTDGGTRRWEASLELRVPVTKDVGVVLFQDMGDVSREPHFRFDYPQAAAGFGLRYFTIVGAIRLDFAWKIDRLQVLAAQDRRFVDLDAQGNPRGRGGKFVFNLSIGEAF